MKPLFLCYPKCSTCKRAIKWLEDNGIEYTFRDITTQNPTASELRQWIEMSALPVRRFFNTSGIKYRELALKQRVDNDPLEELIELLSTDGMLVKRPLLITETTALTGFREGEYSKLLLDK